jgi:hypothetical protein
MSQEIKVVTAFSFWDFCNEVQTLIIEGYRFSSDNEKMPSAYVGNYSCVMVKEKSFETKDEVLVISPNIAEHNPEELNTVQVKTATKGRKPKTN